MSVVVVGLHQRNVPLDLLERMTVAPTDLPKALADLASRDHLDEVVVLSTCLRTEVYVDTDRFHGAVGDIRNFLAEWSFAPPEAFADRLYELSDETAIAHLFKVAAGLESAVLGEGEVLGQVRDAWEAATAEGTSGPVLARLFRHAVEVGKRARTETGIARGTTSLSQAAVALAERELGSLRDRRVLVVGAGEMGEGMAIALAGSGVAGVVVANRTAATAQALADHVAGSAIPVGAVGEALADVDVVLSSTGSPIPLIDVASVAEAMASRDGRPLLLVDLAVPRDIDPAVGAIDGVSLLDMDDITAFAEAGASGRRVEATKVETIVAEEVARYLAAASAQSAAPLVAALRARAEDLRSAELRRHAAKLAALDPQQREAVDMITRGLVAKLLHEPTVHLKDAAGTSRGDRLAEALRTLFDL